MANKYLLSLVQDDYTEPKLIVASETEAKAIKKIVDPENEDYIIHEVAEL